MNQGTERQLTALEQIVAERQDWLFRFAYMRIGLREEAEDVVQEVLLGVFRRLRDQAEVGNLEQYLISAISHACNDYHRRQIRRTVPLKQAEQIPMSEPDQRLHDEYLRVTRMLETLPPEQAETVRLHSSDGLTFHQIALLQDIPEATVKSRYRYAIQHIQQMIKKGDQI